MHLRPNIIGKAKARGMQPQMQTQSIQAINYRDQQQQGITGHHLHRRILIHQSQHACAYSCLVPWLLRAKVRNDETPT